MTDYRPRNDDLLYRGRHERAEDGLRVVAIFGSITIAVALLVTTYLIDAYNPASTGFTAAIPRGLRSRSNPHRRPRGALRLRRTPARLLACF